MEAASSLTIQTKVLGEALADNGLESLLDEVTDSSGILGQVTGSKTLVSAVKEGEVLLLSNNDGKFLPLIERRVNSSGVVSARVQQDDGTIGSTLDGGLHTLEIQAIGLLGEVRVVGNAKANISKDLLVVSPGRVGHVDCPVALVELGEEEGAEMDGSGAGDGLHGSGPLLLEGRGVGAENQLSSLGGEVGNTGNRGIFVVQFGVVSENFVSLLKNGELAMILYSRGKEA